MGITYGAETGYPSGASEFTPVISGICVTRSLVFCVVFLEIIVCPFVLRLLVIVVSKIRYVVHGISVSFSNKA